MPKVKGTAIVVMPQFIKKKFGDEKFIEWLESLPEETKTIFSEPILSSEWYDQQSVLIEPTKKICEMFYNGNYQEGATAIGQYSAEYGVKGIYKLFIKFNTPKWIIEKSTKLLMTYYDSIVTDSKSISENEILITIRELPGIHEVIECRIASWARTAIEMAGRWNVKFRKDKSLAKGDDRTEIVISWDK